MTSRPGRWIVAGLCALTAFLTGMAVAHRGGPAGATLDRHAAEYLDLVAELGALNPESVDFLIGGGHPRPGQPAPTLSSISGRSHDLVAHVRTAAARPGEDALRARDLAARLEALAVRSAQLDGRRLPLADELRLLHAVDLAAVHAPSTHRHDDGRAARDALARKLPGPDPLAMRLARYQRRFIVPRARLDAVIRQAIATCRRQTTRFLTLPEGEQLAVDYVAGRPWSGYSVYRGAYRSVMQVNREMPVTIGQALNLACHEGYPGHHTYNSLREAHAGARLPESAALLIFSPDGFRAEAVASAAAAMTFSAEEQVGIFRDELFPLIRVDPHEAATYAEISMLIDRLSSVTTRIVLRYLSGELDAAGTAAALEREALMEHPEGLVAYIDRYRSYTLAYTWGRDRLLGSISSGTPDATLRWARLEGLMTSPRTQNAARATEFAAWPQATKYGLMNQSPAE